ncbi:MAG: hypothetical protein ACI8TP_000679 [Acidimicrobiales bacterium]
MGLIDRFSTFSRWLLMAIAAIGLVLVPSLAHGAIDNEATVTGMADVPGFDAFSKSFVVEQTGYANMAVVTVEDGELWEVRTARASNCGGTAQAMSFKITDQDGTTYMSMPEGITPIVIPAGETLSWSGRIVVPAGWSVRAEWHDLDASGCTNNAQVTSLVLDGSVQSTTSPT